MYENLAFQTKTSTFHNVSMIDATLALASASAPVYKHYGAL